MSPTDAEPSSRLFRAAVAERQSLARQRERLREARNEVLAELQRIDETLGTLSEREMLLDRLVPVVPGSIRLSTTDSGCLLANPAPPPPSQDEPRFDEHTAGKRVLRGPSIRETAVRLVVTHGRIEALHYRTWFQMLAEAGYTVVGKDPLAVFLTQISRSPVVRKTTQSGVYELDVEAPTRLRRKIADMHDELRELTMRSSDTADLREIRARRKELTAAIGHTERALEEAELMLSTDEIGQTPADALGPALARAS